MRLRALLPTGIATLATSCSMAHVPPPAVVPPAGSVRVEVVDRASGERLPVYWHEGQRWIAGTPGHRYAIALRNQSGGRILAVIAVDGVNALSGETASWDQTGYVLGPRSAAEITGWRKSRERVAAFEFTALEDSYAARTGRPENVGVIGVAVFRERPRVVLAPPPIARFDERGATANESKPPAGAADAERSRADQGATGALARRAEQAPPSRLGTAHGRSETSPVTVTDFERARSQPDEVFIVRYDSRENLIATGVIRRPFAGAPDAFPGSMSGFVPDPPR
jgi:hypothetical protein